MPSNPRDLIAEARAAMSRWVQRDELAPEMYDACRKVADALETALADTERLDWVCGRFDWPRPWTRDEIDAARGKP